VTELPPWLTVTQAAEYRGVDRAELYNKLLPNMEFRRIGTRGGAMPFGRLIRVERGSLLRLCGEPDEPPQPLSRWVTIAKAAEYYQITRHLTRMLIAQEQLDACYIGNSNRIRIDRESLLQLGCYRRTW
jgi:hypothetical protein